MKIYDMEQDLLSEIAQELGLCCRLTSYIVIRSKDDKEEVFCYAGTDIIDAINIVSHMTNKKDGYEYYHSDEVAMFE